MKYKNKLTGVIVVLPDGCGYEGPNWEPVEPAKAPAPTKPAKKKAVKKDGKRSTGNG